MTNPKDYNNNIIIADDTPENIKVLGTILMDEGFQLSVAQNGKEVLEIVQQNTPDLILLDINMPVMNGFETCRYLKMNPATEEIPIIFITSFTDIEHKQKAFSTGGVDYITKPFQKEEILARVTTHLEIAKYRNHLKEEVKKKTNKFEEANKKLKEEIIKNKKIEEALLQAQKMEIVGTLAGGLVHDFNNILGGITGPLSLINSCLKKNNKIEKEKLNEYLGLMTRSTTRATDMVQQLLTLSRKQKLNLHPVDLNDAIKNVIKICNNTFDKSINLIVEYFKKPAIIKADPTQIEQVVLNFCVNASHAMTIMRKKNDMWGGKLSISIEIMTADEHFYLIHPEAKVKKYYIISIEDTGIGMDTNTISKIFNPFFTTKKEEVGTGLGLSMVYNIVKEHNGFINVYSELKVGTLFNIFFPVLEEKIAPKNNKKINKNILNQNGLILVVEDEEVIRFITRDMLEECGYDVIFAENGEKGIEIFNKHCDEIKVVILDMVMPEMSGKDAYIKMKKIDPDVKVLLTSGFKQNERIEEMLDLGVNGFIHKPYTLEKLALAVYNIISDIDNQQ